MKYFLLIATIPTQALGSLYAFLRFGFDMGYRRTVKWLLVVFGGSV